jgi:uncharacterized Tic20 family protein
MTSEPPEPPAQWPPSPEEGPASHGRQPGQPDEWQAFQRSPGEQPVNGRRAAAAYPRGGGAMPLADYPPDAGYEQHAPGHPPAASFGPDDYRDHPEDPDYPAAPGYPGPAGRPRDGLFPADYPDQPDGYSPVGYPDRPGGYPPASYADQPGNLRDGYLPTSYPSMPDYPPTPDYPATPGYPPAPGHLDAQGYRRATGLPAAGDAQAGYSTAGYSTGGYSAGGYRQGDSPPGVDAGGSQTAGIPGALVTHEEYVHPGGLPAADADVLRAAAGSAPGEAAEAAQATGSEATRWAMLAYLTVPFFGFLVPLAIYLTPLRGSSWVRAHAAQAINVWLTGILYDLSATIIGAMLVLDSPRVALTVVLPLAAALWLTTLAFLVRAATTAARGETYAFPRWLCAPIVR